MLNLACVFSTQLRGTMVFEELVQRQWMIKEHLGKEVLVCLDCFGGHKALCIISCSSRGFDRGRGIDAPSLWITPPSQGYSLKV